MRKLCYFAAGMLVLALLPLAAQQTTSEEKAAGSRTLKVKLNYTGTGTVDGKHQIIVFLFDSPDFVQGGVMPFATASGSAKDEVMTFSDLTVSPVYAVAVYDPTGEYDGQSGPPPSGASMGMYSKTPGQPEPIAVEAGKTEQVELAFDDSFKLP
jgi:hypothetical protein